MREIENYDNFEKHRSSKIPDIIEKYNLTPRQCEILSLRFSGVTKKADVAQRLGIGVSTLYREMQSKPLQLAIGELSIQLLEQNQTDARNLTQVALDYLLSVIDSPDIPVDIKLKATKQAVEATTALDRAKIEDEVMRVWRSNAVPQVSNMLESSGDFDLLE